MKNQSIFGQVGSTFTGWTDSVGFTGVIPTGIVGGSNSPGFTGHGEAPGHSETPGHSEAPGCFGHIPIPV